MAGREELVLALDGSLRQEPLALLVGTTGEAGPEAAEGPLVAAVRRLLEARRADLVRVLAGRGPGSYMGVRTALAAALGVAQSLSLPLVLVGSLELEAARVEPVPGPVLALADAGRGGTYGQLLEPVPEGWRALAPAGHLDRAGDWPREWSRARAAVGEPGAGRELPAGLQRLAPARSRAAALALIAQRCSGPASDYDLVSADYPEATGAR